MQFLRRLPRPTWPSTPAAALALLGRLVVVLANLVALVLVLGIVFVELKANHNNGVVGSLLDFADSLAGPFNRMFIPSDPQLAISVNWAIALIVYSIAARMVAGVLTRGGSSASS